MKILAALLILCFCGANAYSQTITGIEYTADWHSPKKLTPVSGKGIYMLVKEGLVLYNPATKKVWLYNLTDSNKAVSELTGLAIHKDRIVVHSSDKVYQLLPSGRFKDISPNDKRISSFARIHHISLNDNEIALTAGSALVSYKNNQWVYHLPKNNLLNQYQSRPSRFLPLGENNYLVTREKMDVMLAYNSQNEKSSDFALAGNKDMVFMPGNVLWYLNEEDLAYTNFSAKRITGSIPASLFPGKLTDNPMRRIRTYGNSRLFTNENQEVFFMNADTVLQLGTSYNNDSAVNIMLLKTAIAEVVPSIKSEYVIYNNVLYEGFELGLVAHRRGNKDTVLRASNHFNATAGRHLMMPNGMVYTKDDNDLHWSDGKSRPGMAHFNSVITDIATDGKNLYVLTAYYLYKETRPGIFEELMPSGANAADAVAFAKNGDIWMASYLGITIISKGNREFIPASSITGFPKEAFYDIAISPEGEVLLSFKQVYKYKDKVLTPVTAENDMLSTHHFDGQGNDYIAGINEHYFYDGQGSKKIKQIIAASYPDKKIFYVGGFSIDEKGRCWTIVNFLGETGIMIFDKGKPVSYIQHDLLPKLDINSQRIFVFKEHLLIVRSRGGWIIVKYT